MVVVSYLQLILPLLLVICCIIGQGESNDNRRRREATGDSNRNGSPRNSDGLVSSNNMQFNPSNNPNNLNNQQQSNNNLLPSSQGQGQASRSGGFYNSPAFKPPTFSGDKPTGWFETKYSNWVSNLDGQLDTNNMIDGKNAPPSSLQGRGIQPRREDGGAFFLQKAAKHYASKGEKVFSFGPYNAEQRRASICTNHQNFNGYTFGKFPCPLPAGTGMNQLDQFCCGPANYQYCCNAQEFDQDRSGRFSDVYNDKQRHSKHLHYSPRTNRALAIVLPVAGVLVIVGAVIILVFYYKKLQNEQSQGGKSASATRLNDNYSAVPQDVPIEKPAIPPRKGQNTTVQA